MSTKTVRLWNVEDAVPYDMVSYVAIFIFFIYKLDFREKSGFHP